MNLEEKIKSLHGSGVSGLAVIIGNRSGISNAKFSGGLHHSSHIPIDQNTKFDIQSITKIYLTVPLLLEQVRTGSIRLEDPVFKYLPEFISSRKNEIQIIDLINHTSGLSDDSLCFDFVDHQSAWAQMLTIAPRKPGHNRVEYSDLNYRILGRLIEVVSGVGLKDLAEKYFEKVNVKSKFGPFKNPETAKVAGGSNNWGRVDDEQDLFLGGCVGCDGIFASARDIATFCETVLSNSELKSLLTEHSTKNQSSKSTDCQSYYQALAHSTKSLGWEENPIPFRYSCFPDNHRVIEKAGGGGSFISIDLTAGEYFIYLTNHGRPDPFLENSWNDLVALLNPVLVCRAMK